MSYTPNPTNPTIINVNPGSTIDDLITANPTATQFIFAPGNYYITADLFITISNLTLTGSVGDPIYVHIFQQNPNADGIVFKNVSHVTMTGISIHNTNDGKVALTAASVNYLTIQNCYIYGNATTFTIYFAGPSNLVAGQPTLTAYTNNALDGYNVFNNNVVYSKWSGDAVSFSLQKNGTFTNNIIRGGKASIYMCRKCFVAYNTVYDSTSQGFYISFPSDNITLEYNKIYKCTASGITMANQQEHGPFTEYPYNILVRYNRIYNAGDYGIELNNCNTVTINQNKFVENAIYIVYLLDCTNVKITSNLLSYYSIAVYCESSTNNLFNSNIIYSVYPDNGNNVFKLVNNSTNNSITNNTIKGMLLYDLYSIDSTCTGTVMTNNVQDIYYEHTEELSSSLFIVS